MGTKGKVALLVLMVGLVGAIIVWDHASQKEPAASPPPAASGDSLAGGSLGGLDSPSPGLTDGPAPATSTLTVADPIAPAGSAATLTPGSAPSATAGGSPSSLPVSAGGPGLAPASGGPAGPATPPVPVSPSQAAPLSGPRHTDPWSPAARPGTIDTRPAPGAPTAPALPGRPGPADPPSPRTIFDPEPRDQGTGAVAGKTHKVQDGDSLWTIAVKYYKNGTKLDRIRDANRDKIGEGDLLRVGTTLTIPESDTASAATPGRGHDAGEQPVGTDEYRVKSGDSLSSIAKDKLGKEYLWEEIAKANEGVLKGDPHRLTVGTVLRIPPAPESNAHGSGTRREIREAEVPPEFQGRRTYKIKSGDNLWKVAKDQLGNGTKWEKIYQANRDRIDPEHLKVGQVIVLPDEGSTPSSFDRPRESSEIRPGGGGGLAPLPSGPSTTIPTGPSTPGGIAPAPPLGAPTPATPPAGTPAPTPPERR